MGTASLSELPGIKPFICRIHMFLRGATSRRQQQEEPAGRDARSASGQQAGRVLWAEGLRWGWGGVGDREMRAVRGRWREGQTVRDTERPGA